MQHLIFTKFNMPGFEGHPHINPEWLDERIELFGKWLLPSMKQQTCQDFEWIMHCWYSTPSEQKGKLIELEKTYDNLRIMWLQNKAWHQEWLENIRDIVEPGPLLTSRVDSDDAVSKHYVKTVQGVKADPGNFICCETGIMHEVQTGKCYIRQYPRSPFMAYSETSYSDAPRDINTVHLRQHCHAEPVLGLTSQYPMWLQNVHGGNRGNKFNPPGAVFSFKSISKDFIGE